MRTGTAERKLIDLIGEAEALSLIEMHGGQRVYIPHRPAESRLSAEVGPTALQRLSERFKGTWVKIPLARFWRVQVYHQAGLTHSEIARRLVVTVTTVDRILRNAGMTKGDTRRARRSSRAASGRRRVRASCKGAK